MSNKSIKAYETAIPQVSKKIGQICEVLKNRGNQTTGEIEFHTGMHYSTLTARLSDAWDMGLILPLNESSDPRYSTWRLAEVDERDYIVQRREMSKMIKWLKNGLKYENRLPKQFSSWIKNELGI